MSLTKEMVREHIKRSMGGLYETSISESQVYTPDQAANYWQDKKPIVLFPADGANSQVIDGVVVQNHETLSMTNNPYQLLSKSPYAQPHQGRNRNILSFFVRLIDKTTAAKYNDMFVVLASYNALDPDDLLPHSLRMTPFYNSHRNTLTVYDRPIRRARPEDFKQKFNVTLEEAVNRVVIGSIKPVGMMDQDYMLYSMVKGGIYDVLRASMNLVTHVPTPPKSQNDLDIARKNRINDMYAYSVYADIRNWAITTNHGSAQLVFTNGVF